MGDPIPVAFPVDWPKTTTVSKHRPGPLRCLTPCLPAKNQFSGYPGIGLDMTNLEGNRHHMPGDTRFDVHGGNTRRACSHAAWSIIRIRGDAIRQVPGGFLPSHPEIHPFIIGVQGHVTTGPHAFRRGATNPLVDFGGLHLSFFTVGKQCFKIHLDNLYGTATPLNSPHKIQLHGTMSQIKHTHVPTFRYLHQVAGLLMHGHGFTPHPIRPKHQPLTIGCPLMMSLIDFLIALPLRTG
ncbi:MAG: hypothetical protein BWY72_01934 [Bacteroidetes bacterium ADurb.Bin416]|nr:MAG: hypothetical protein BWY72_01934 [Bacteroidetes bacterium ADurb.Bin416]